MERDCSECQRFLSCWQIRCYPLSDISKHSVQESPQEVYTLARNLRSNGFLYIILPPASALLVGASQFQKLWLRK